MTQATFSWITSKMKQVIYLTEADHNPQPPDFQFALTYIGGFLGQAA